MRTNTNWLKILITILSLSGLTLLLYLEGYHLKFWIYFFILTFLILSFLFLFDGILHFFNISQFEEKYNFRKSNSLSWISFINTIIATLLSIVLIFKMPDYSKERIANFIKNDTMIEINATITSSSKHSYKGNAHMSYDIEYVINKKRYKTCIEDYNIKKIYTNTMVVNVCLQHPEIIVFNGSIF